MACIDTHCHLDADEFGTTLQGRLQVRQRAREVGVALCVYPAVNRAGFSSVRELAHASADAYALGVHPLYVSQSADEDLAELEQLLARDAHDPRLVAVGEIGLDFLVDELRLPQARARQEHFYRQQLALAQAQALPVILHVRRSADALLAGLRRTRFCGGGIAHAFNGSLQQAKAFLDLGFKLGFGGAMTHERALQLRRLATTLPLDALVLETDAPDMPPQWLYVPAARRAAGEPVARNEPGQLPRIAAVLAALRGIDVQALVQATTRNACQALPRLKPLMEPPDDAPF